ncbi:hypothetical protein QBC41DRAFT_321844 [Cercophora samala]|uniref:Uncharacterized protein n=1 Tax=Cercophora samala TaxID=330535 RepID=A0AA39ZCJ2_9PEZI|nr:hypothetical protein QBC41DRAFT_321844 [Cercophora samala]
MDFPAVPNHAVGYGYQQKQQGVARQGQQVSGSVGSGARNLTLGQDTAARKIQGTGEKAPNDIHPQEPGDHPAQQAEVGHPHVLQNQQGEQGEEAAVDGQEGKVDEKKQDDGEKSEAVKSPSADQNTGSDEINETPETPETQNNNDTSIDDAHNGNNQNHGDHERLDANVYDSTPIQGTNETTAATNGDLADAVQEDGGSSGSAEMLPKIPGAWPTV